MSNSENYYEEIDNYKDSVSAIIGFMNFYRYNDAAQEIDNNVLVFQGRRLEPSMQRDIEPNGATYVTPDIGILLPAKNGVLAEVKKSFPKEQVHWIKTFKQLMSYDDDLRGWPSVDKVNSHDIVLVLHHTRANAVRKYFESNKGAVINFKRPFCIVEFSRSDERNPYFFFRIQYGSLTDNSINMRLENGIQVPMIIFVSMYSTIKIYDSEPPLPYLLELMWTNVVLKTASENTKFEKLIKGHKIEVVLEIGAIVEELHQGFSFHTLHDGNEERQPKVPKKEWVMCACEKLVELDEASWVDSTKKTINVFFRKYDDVLGHFIEVCSMEVETPKQLKLFKVDERN